MPTVSLNLTEQAYRAYQQIPRGSRSRVLSAVIARRDLEPKMKGEGLLADMGYTTPREAILDLEVRIDRMGATLANRDARIAKLLEDD
ncbi:MAG TPA: hypothetical protein EYN66_18625 [Myxococcales bacterium]|nr:hypothetical protein [Myxococcales bacterium]